MASLSQAFVKALAPVEGDSWFWDDELKGFHIRARPGAAPVWGVRYTIGRRKRTYVIGPVHELKAKEARERATDIRSKARLGVDVQDERKEARSVPTIGELAELHQAKHCYPLISEKREKNNKTFWKRYIIPVIGKARLANEITALDLARLRKQLEDKRATFNAVRGCLSKALNDFKLPNPCSESKRFKDAARDVVLEAHETHAILAIMRPRRFDEYRAWALIYLLLTSGLRFSELARRRWRDFDAARGTLVVPLTKGGNTRTVYLSRDAIETLSKLPRDDKAIFPKLRGEGHLTSVKWLWVNILKQAGVDYVRIHDIRHSAASTAHHKAGLSIKEVSLMLGHASVATTEKYLNVHQRRERAISEIAASAILGVS